MSSSNDAKFTTYKSDMRNRHFNTQVPEEISTGSIQEQMTNPELSDNIYEKKNYLQPNHNEAILEKIQESFSDHEEMQGDNEQDEERNSSCVRETYTVDSSSDDNEVNNKSVNDQSLFSELSQVNLKFEFLI
jgi:hypothetical protein